MIRTRRAVLAQGARRFSGTIVFKNNLKRDGHRALGAKARAISASMT
jgi:hypothetical protein